MSKQVPTFGYERDVVRKLHLGRYLKLKSKLTSEIFPQIVLNFQILRQLIFEWTNHITKIILRSIMHKSFKRKMNGTKMRNMDTMARYTIKFLSRPTESANICEMVRNVFNVEIT